MASRLLFDIAALDLDAIAVSADEVGSINPQCGDMRMLDHLAWLSPDASESLGVRRVRDDEFWVPGHIPGRPLMPGVLLVEAAAQLCSVMFKRKHDTPGFLGFTRINDVAFRGQVVPGDTLYLLARELSYSPRRFVSEAQGVVNGSLVFEARITGMPIG